MTRAVGDDDTLLKSLQEVVGLFKDAQTSVFKLMSSVSAHSSHTSFNILIVADDVSRIPFRSSSKNPSMPLCWLSTTLIMQWHKQTNTDHRRWSCRSDREVKSSEIGTIGHRNQYDLELHNDFGNVGRRRR